MEQKDFESLLLNYFTLEKLDHCKNSESQTEFRWFFETACQWLYSPETQKNDSDHCDSQASIREHVWDRFSDWTVAAWSRSIDIVATMHMTHPIILAIENHHNRFQSLLSHCKGFQRAIHLIGCVYNWCT